jgi:hypothetical protein
MARELDEQLARVAERAGDQETAALARRILEQARAAVGVIAGKFDVAVSESLRAVGAAA